MVWNINDSQGRESDKIKYEIVPYTKGRVLDLGCGPWKAFPHFIGVDNFSEWSGFKWKPDILTDCSDLSLFASGSVDAVFSSHLLEHIQDTEKALKEWFRVVKNGGYLILYLPHKDFYPNIGQEGASEHHLYDFHPKDIITKMKSAGGWDLIVSENRNQGSEYSFFQVYKKKPEKGRHDFSYAKPKPEKTCGIVRYGGFGDMVQTASLLPTLKDLGYHITMFCSPKGHDIIKTDPHIDEFIIQDVDQVPNAELMDFWNVWAKKFDKWINLSESVEGTFLAMHNRINHQWGRSAKEKLMNFNYVEFMHAIGDLPYTKPAQCFYPTQDEKKWAKKQKAKIGGRVVLFALSGSSLHKVWPHMDQAIARMMLHTDYSIVTMGDEACKLLEQGWEKEPRVIKKSGKWSIRETLAFAEECDLVIGPETGILNSVAMLDIPKIIFLSHSSVENLTRDWVNCYSLTPDGCECYPCHMLHYGVEHCNYTMTENTAYAECANKISVDKFWEAIIDINMRKAA